MQRSSTPNHGAPRDITSAKVTENNADLSTSVTTTNLSDNNRCLHLNPSVDEWHEILKKMQIQKTNFKASFHTNGKYSAWFKMWDVSGTFLHVFLSVYTLLTTLFCDNNTSNLYLAFLDAQRVLKRFLSHVDIWESSINLSVCFQQPFLFSS